MTLKELHARLKNAGYPVAYRAFKSAQKPPFICYLVAYDHNFSADGQVYSKAKHVQVELYTTTKNEAAEANVENALAGLFFEKSETYIDTDRIYQILYEIEV